MSRARAGSLGALIRSAKEKAPEKGAKMMLSALNKVDKGRAAASERAILAKENGAKLLGRAREKAQEARERAEEAVAVVSAKVAEVRGSGSATGSGSPGAFASTSASSSRSLADDPRVQEICKRGFTQVAARLALAHCDGGATSAEACKWLLDEANGEDILAAEAGEVWFAAEQREEAGSKAPASAEGGLGFGLDSGAAATPERRCCPEAFLEGEEVCLFSPSPAPAQASQVAPPPRQQHAGAVDDQAEGEQDRPQEEFFSLPLEAGEDEQQADCSADLSEADVDSSPESAEEEDVMAATSPPDGGSWEWPLSRHETSARLQNLDRRMAELDRKVLMEALVKERLAARVARRQSTTGK